MSIQVALDKLIKLNGDAKEIHADLLQVSPKTSLTFKLAEEVENITEAISDLVTHIQELQSEADTLEQTKESVLKQIEKHGYINNVNQELQNQIAEKVVQGEPLLTQEEMREKAIDQHLEKPVESLLSEFPTSFLVELGKNTQRTDEDAQKTNYEVGVEAFKALATDKEKLRVLIGNHIDQVMQRSPVKFLKHMYGLDQVGI